MPKTYWLIDEEPTIPADYVTGERFPPSRGEVVEITAVFRDTGRSWKAEVDEPVIEPFDDRWRAVRDFIEFPEQVATGVDSQGEPWFRERPGASPAGSQLVKIRPPAHIRVEPFWGVVVDGQDASSTTGRPLRIQLSVTYLGDTSDFPAESDVRGALEAQPTLADSCPNPVLAGLRCVTEEGVTRKIASPYRVRGEGAVQGATVIRK